MEVACPKCEQYFALPAEEVKVPEGRIVVTKCPHCNHRAEVYRFSDAFKRLRERWEKEQIAERRRASEEKGRQREEEEGRREAARVEEMRAAAAARKAESQRVLAVVRQEDEERYAKARRRIGFIEEASGESLSGGLMLFAGAGMVLCWIGGIMLLCVQAADSNSIFPPIAHGIGVGFLGLGCLVGGVISGIGYLMGPRILGRPPDLDAFHRAKRDLKK